MTLVVQRTCNCGAADVIIDITDGSMEQFLDGLVVAGATVGHGNGVHPTAPQNGILVSGQALDQGVGLLQPAVHDEGDADSEPPQNLLVLGLLGVGHHVLDGPTGLASQLTEPHGQTCSLASDSVVLVEAELELLIHIGPVASHGSQAKAKAASMLDLLA